MPRAKLTDELRDQVLAMRAAKKPAAQVVAWLKTEHGIDYTVGGVNKLTRTHAKASSGDAKKTVRKSLAKTLPKNLQFIEKILKDYQRVYANQLRDALADEPIVEPLHKTVEMIRKLIDLNLHYSGADQPDVAVTDLAAFMAKVRPKT